MCFVVLLARALHLLPFPPFKVLSENLIPSGDNL